MFEVLTPKQMISAEQSAVELGVSLKKLMDTAGAKLAKCIFNCTKRFTKSRTVILVGAGNNGGDGLVAANYLLDYGINPVIIMCSGEPRTDLAQQAFSRLDTKIIVLDKRDDKAMKMAYSADVIVDCIFGTGFHGTISDELGLFLKRINTIKCYKLACDVPSGVNALSGQVSENTFIANETLTFHKYKIGLFISPGKEYCGKLYKASINIPEGWEDKIDMDISTATVSSVLRLLPQRSSHSHKGTFGRCVLICGSGNYPGAAIISAMSALRSGVGIVNLCTSVPVSSLVGTIPEATFTQLISDEKGFISNNNIETILENIKNATSVVIGCGLGKTEDTKEIVEQVIKNANCPIIIDADGINCLSEHIDVLKEKQTEIILTPHIGELARLCGVTIAEIEGETLQYARQLAQEYNVIVHAKNTQTLTVSATSCVITDFGCSALAKGGSGDMLAGLIGSLSAQGLGAIEACVLADYIMGRTANILCETDSPRGILATDIIAHFPKMLCQADRGVII